MIAIGSDHAGFDYKELLKAHLQQAGKSVLDCGTFSIDSCDYPDYAHAVASKVEKGECERGILICGSANGVAIVANKHPNVRAALCWNKDIAALARLHNDANIVCLPARFITPEDALGILTVFLNSSFEGGRHCRRVEKINL